MHAIPPAIECLARQLIAREAARDSSDGPAGAAVRTCTRLRVPLARLGGEAGFRSLLGRALALASAAVPGLESARVGADGSLEGVEGDAGEAGVAVVAHLLGLLVTFIGEPLTSGLIGDAWPDAPADETDRTGGGRP